MELPDSSLLNFFNKLLISLEDLRPDGDFCSVRTLTKHCRSVALGGQRADYDAVISHCRFAGLLHVHSSKVRISSLGKRFLTANPKNFFEITESQKHLLVERIVFKGSWSIIARELLSFFSLNQTLETYEFSKVDRSLPSDMTSAAHLLKHLGVLFENEDAIQVDKHYAQLVYELMMDSRTLTELELERILAENRKLGVKAENAIVEFEKKRLLALGRDVQASLVRRISVIDVAAGYDIESFDGDSDDLTPNRFIEVKGTSKADLRFYWTRNEKEKAVKLKKRYWIYAIVGMKDGRSYHCQPIMIQDPAREIPRHAFLTMEAHTYFVNQDAGLSYEEQNLQEVRWFTLS